MRDIKFRAWDGKHIRLWGDREQELDGEEWFCSPWEFVWRGIEQVSKNYVLMQYTGLKDKNGREIYEGDICRHPSGHVAPVRWDEELYAFSFYMNRYVVDQEAGCVRDGDVEVIGNIYDNHELLDKSPKVLDTF